MPPTPAIERDLAADRRLSRRGLAALGGVVAGAALIAVAAAHTESLLPESIRPVPASLAGAFGSLFLNLHVGGAIAALVLLFISYAAVVALSGQLSARVVLMAIVAVHARRAPGPAAGLHRRLQLPGVRADGRGLWDQPLHARSLRQQPRPRLPVRRGQVVNHPERLRARVHGLQLPAGAADDRHQRLRLQVDRGRGQPRAGGRGVALRPAARRRPRQGGCPRRPQSAARDLRGRRRPQRPADAAGDGRRRLRHPRLSGTGGRRADRAGDRRQAHRRPRPPLRARRRRAGPAAPETAAVAWRWGPASGSPPSPR